jgi:hypothetical protein
MATKVYKNSIFLKPKFGKVVVVFSTWHINNLTLLLTSINKSIFSRNRPIDFTKQSACDLCSMACFKVGNV